MITLVVLGEGKKRKIIWELRYLELSNRKIIKKVSDKKEREKSLKKKSAQQKKDKEVVKNERVECEAREEKVQQCERRNKIGRERNHHTLYKITSPSP